MVFGSSKLLQLLMDSRIQDYLGNNKEILPPNFDYLTILSFLLWGAGIYIPTYLMAGTVKQMLEPKITTRKELNKVIEEEKEKLGLKSKIDYLIDLEKPAPSIVIKDRMGTYWIYLDQLPTRSLIAHELHHIYDGWVDRTMKFINAGKKIPLKETVYYLFVEEPRTILYSLSGIRL